MKLGTDIAYITLKKQEGVDFILEPMGQTINDDLNEHIDGIRSKIKYFIPKEQ